MMWNLQSYLTTVLNERMWHFRELKHTLIPLTYFQGSRPPNPQDLRPCCYALLPNLEKIIQRHRQGSRSRLSVNVRRQRSACLTASATGDDHPYSNVWVWRVARFLNDSYIYCCVVNFLRQRFRDHCCPFIFSSASMRNNSTSCGRVLTPACNVGCRRYKFYWELHAHGLCGSVV